MSNPLEKNDLALAAKLGQALKRIGLVQRSEHWSTTYAAGLNPTQGFVLELLGSRAAPWRLAELAERLGVSPASTSATVSALEEKGLVRKERAEDARALAISLTADGRRRNRKLNAGEGAVEAALERLDQQAQTALLRTLLETIGNLQSAGAISTARMCVTCSHFRPWAHPQSKTRPHHCALVDAAFGDASLRVDCQDHEPTADARINPTWTKRSPG